MTTMAGLELRGDSTGELGSSSRPPANIAAWQFHLQEADNARKLLNLPDDVQHYFVGFMTWLAELMTLRVNDCHGFSFDRLCRMPGGCLGTGPHRAGDRFAGSPKLSRSPAKLRVRRM